MGTVLSMADVGPRALKSLVDLLRRWMDEHRHAT